jgi:glycosyltransferase involved in cell wall biosynthesis
VAIVFFNRFFHPDTSATSQILSDLAFHLAGRGHKVLVVTSASEGLRPGVETVNGVEVHRVARSAHAPGGIVGRAISYLAYHSAARSAARRMVRAGDVVVVKTDPPMLGASIGPIARTRGARVVNWLQDLFPEVAERHGVTGVGGPFAAWLRRVRDRAIAAADRNVAVGDRMAQYLRGTVGPRAHLAVIHNWSSGALIKPIAPAANPLRGEWGLGDAFVVGYSGNLGRVHEFDTLLRAAGELRAERGIRFLIIGRGPRLQDVRRRAASLKLDNMGFEPHQHRTRLPQSLCAPDVHVASLAPEYEGLVQPSKLYGVMAAGRPTIFIGDPAGETAAILAETGSGLAIPAGDAAGLAAAIRSLAADPARVQRMGRAARAAFEARYDLPVALARWEELLSSLSK